MSVFIKRNATKRVNYSLNSNIINIVTQMFKKNGRLIAFLKKIDSFVTRQQIGLSRFNEQFVGSQQQTID